MSHFFCREYLTLKSRTCSTATGMDVPAAGLAATPAAGLGTVLGSTFSLGLGIWFCRGLTLLWQPSLLGSHYLIRLNG